MINVICQRRSNTARALRAALAAFPNLRGDVNWTGAGVAGPALNQHSFTNKLRQLEKLKEKNVPVPPFARTGAAAGWLPRSANHQQGFDFTRFNGRGKPRGLQAARADFFVKKLTLTHEWRLHFFKTKKGNLKLLRSGQRLPIPGHPRVHPWVRSHRLGWKISYTGGASAGLVEAGRKAMEALNLDFGAVDLGVTAEGAPVVLEVNTCPGLEGGMLQKYVEAIKERLQP